MKPLVATCLICLCISTISQSYAAEAAPGSQTQQHLSGSIPVEIDYLLYLPKDYEQKDAWPLMLFLHGAGERGDDLEAVKRHGPPKLIAAGENFPFVVVSPQCPTRQWWEPMKLTALIDQIEKSYKIDKDRIYVTGLSMGGFGTWALAAYTPDRFAAAVPICGRGEPRAARNLTHLPIWVFHGAKDPAVPLRNSEEMVSALKEQGGNVKFTVYPDVGHDSWTAAYADPELYKWLLEQRRTTASK